MLTITVGTGKQYLITADGREVQVHEATVRSGSKNQEFRDCSGFFDDISFSFRSHELALPDRIRAKIAYFLATHQGQQRIEMDCYAFANLTYDLPEHSCREMHQYWKLRRLWLSPRAGQAVFFLSPKERIFHHAAIYLGKGLYISAYGAGGDLEITDLKDMLRDFRAEKAFLALPKVNGRRL